MLLIGTKTNQPETPVYLSLDGALHHTLIVGQSGSGKSFLVARLIEELLLRTRARVLIVDPNGDFRSLHRVSDAVWHDLEPRFQEVIRAQDGAAIDNLDKPDAFQRRWQRRRFVYLSPGPPSLPDTEMVLHRRLYLHWENLDEDERDFLLRVNPAQQAKLLLGLEAVQKNAQWIQLNRPELPYGFDLRGMLAISEHFANRNVGMSEYEYAKSLAPDDWYAVRTHLSEVLKRYRLWWSSGGKGGAGEHPADLLEFVDGPFDEPKTSGTYWDALALTLDSSRESDTLLSVDVALLRLWKRAKEAWRRRVEGVEGDPVPTFVVLDEAHNFAPRVTADPIRARVTDRLLQIASEGRKYGLYLVLATQRPTKLHPELVPECENSCVLRVQSKHETEFASRVLGIPDNTAQVVSSFTRGQGLFSGRWVDGHGPIDTRVAPARTIVGGGGIGHSWTDAPQATPPYMGRPAMLKELAEYLDGVLRASEDPVTLVSLANAVSGAFEDIQPPDWLGAGGFRQLLEELPLSGLGILTDRPPGFAYLEEIHDVSGLDDEAVIEGQAAVVVGDAGLSRTLARIHRETSLPLLEGESFKAIYEALSQEVERTEFSLSEVSKAVRDQLKASGVPVGRSAVNYVMKGIHLGSHNYDSDLPQDPLTLATAFWRALRGSLERNDIILDPEMEAALATHVTGGLIDGHP